MDFRILGPLEIISGDGTPVTPRRFRERTLAAVLLLFAGFPCSREMLVRALWGDGAPADPAAALRVCVCRTRRALGPANCLTTLDGALRADPAPGDLDLTRFRQARHAAERMLQHSRLRPASAELQRALDCWRSPALAELPDSLEIAAERARLMEQRRTIELTLADVLLELGDHDRILADLHERVVTEPLCERGWAQLITALHLGGRRREALAAYSRARVILVRSLGTEPGAELQHLLQLVLDGRPPESRYFALSVTGNPALERAPARVLGTGPRPPALPNFSGLSFRLCPCPGPVKPRSPGAGKGR